MDYDKICYNTNFIKTVILKIDWESVEPFLTEDIVTKLISFLPLYEKRTEKQVRVEIQPKKQQSSSTEATNHVFMNSDKDLKFTISELQNAIWLETTKYNKWDEFYQIFVNLLDIICIDIKENTIKRIGLRFINQIPVKNYTELKKYFAKPIHGIFIDNSYDKEMSRLFIIKEQNFSDYQIRFQFGIPNQYYPNPILNPEFVLDIDNFANLNYNFDEVKKIVINFHDNVQQIFENSITDNFRKLMGIQNNGK